jgi:hypothetical protein
MAADDGCIFECFLHKMERQIKTRQQVDAVKRKLDEIKHKIDNQASIHMIDNILPFMCYVSHKKLPIANPLKVVCHEVTVAVELNHPKDGIVQARRILYGRNGRVLIDCYKARNRDPDHLKRYLSPWMKNATFLGNKQETLNQALDDISIAEKRWISVVNPHTQESVNVAWIELDLYVYFLRPDFETYPPDHLSFYKIHEFSVDLKGYLRGITHEPFFIPTRMIVGCDKTGKVLKKENGEYEAIYDDTTYMNCVFIRKKISDEGPFKAQQKKQRND